MGSRITKGNLGTLRLQTTTTIPADDPLVSIAADLKRCADAAVDLKRCADALEQLASVFEPEPVPVRAAWTLGVPVEDEPKPTNEGSS